MSKYRLWDLVLESRLPLPELLPANGQETGCVFHLLAPDQLVSSPIEWHQHYRDADATIWLSCARRGSDYLLRFPGQADFLTSADGKEIRCSPAPRSAPESIRHLLLDHVVPLMLGQQSRAVLHGSAVQAPEGAIVFLGASGMGKSTLAASFCAQGLALLADDALVVAEQGSELFVIPSYPGLRLWPDVAAAFPGLDAGPLPGSEKRRLGLDDNRLRFGSAAVPLARLYVLAAPQGCTGPISVVAMSRRDAFMALVKNAFGLELAGPERLREQFERLVRLTAAPRFGRLSFPRELALLPAVRDAILGDLRGCG